jgi:hypothetical protein
LGDGTVANTSQVTHSFLKPGFYRVGLTVNDGILSNLAWRDFYVVAPLPELGTEGDALRWGWSDPNSEVVFRNDPSVQIAGGCSLAAVVRPYSGGRVNFEYPRTKDARWPLADKSQLVFWVKATNENVPAWQGPNPVTTLYGLDGQTARLTPKTDWLAQPPYNEAREGWTYITVPLRGNDQWVLEGKTPQTACGISLGFDSWGNPPLQFWIDGLAFE